MLMVLIKKEGIVLEPRKFKFEESGVLNPGCIKKGNNVHMFYRAVAKGNLSSVGYCKFKGPLDVEERWRKPILKPENHYEKHGIEDPRIVHINGKYHLTYMAYDGKDVTGAYAVSKNLKNFDKKGVIVPLIPYAEAMKLMGKRKNKRYRCFELYDRGEKDTEKTTPVWGKDTVLFPKKIKGKYVLMHRILPDVPLIKFKRFSDLTVDYWKEHFKDLPKNVMLKAERWFESRHVGGGCPPIETKKGWLIIYHAVEKREKGKVYRGAAALVDKKDPTKIISKLDYPLISPEIGWEQKGEVGNVVFPTGHAVFGKKLYLYYGCADSRIAAASLYIDELVDEQEDKGKK